MTVADPVLARFIAGTKIKAAEVNANFDAMVQYIKDNIVAMNETISTWSSVISSIGTLGDLLTTAKDSLVNAINELKNSQLKFGTCTTASATSEKAVTASGFTYKDGAQLYIPFTNANTASVPTINANSLGAKSIYTKSGHAIDGTNYFAYFPANCNILFTYSSTLGGFYFDNKIVDEYINGTSWYRVYSDGWIEQGYYVGGTGTATPTTLSFLKSFKNTNYSVVTSNVTSSSGVGSDWFGAIVPSSETVSSLNYYSWTFLYHHFVLQGY